MEKRSFEWEYLPPEIKQEIAYKIIATAKSHESKKLFATLQRTCKYFNQPNFVKMYTENACFQLNLEKEHYKNTIEEKESFIKSLHRQCATPEIRYDSLAIANIIESIERCRAEINPFQEKIDSIEKIVKLFKQRLERTAQ